MKKLKKIPSAIELEEIVLGAIIMEKEAIEKIVDILIPEAFYTTKNSIIYCNILEMYNNNEAIDILTITEKLRKNNQLEKIGGALYISQLTNRIASAYNIEYHAKIIMQKHIRRKLIEISGKIYDQAYDETKEISDIIQYSENEYEKAINTISSATYIELVPAIRDRLKDYEKIILKKEKDIIVGITSGSKELNRYTGGWQNSDMIIVAGRPSMGKTSIAIQWACNAAKENYNVGFFSLEMNRKQLIDRIVSRETEYTPTELRNGNIDFNVLYNKLHINYKVYICDTPALNIFDMKVISRKWVKKNNVKLIIIDYLQLLTQNNRNLTREQEVSTLSRSVKALAKELDIPIILLSQLSRELEKRGGDKIPKLSDLRDSGAIEQDADIVMFVHRPEYYNIMVDENNNSLENVGQIIISKHRNGALGTILYNLRDDKMVWNDFDENNNFFKPF